LEVKIYCKINNNQTYIKNVTFKALYIGLFFEKRLPHLYKNSYLTIIQIEESVLNFLFSYPE